MKHPCVKQPAGTERTGLNSVVNSCWEKVPIPHMLKKAYGEVAVPTRYCMWEHTFFNLLLTAVPCTTPVVVRTLHTHAPDAWESRISDTLFMALQACICMHASPSLACPVQRHLLRTSRTWCASLVYSYCVPVRALNRVPPVTHTCKNASSVACSMLAWRAAVSTRALWTSC